MKRARKIFSLKELLKNQLQGFKLLNLVIIKNIMSLKRKIVILVSLWVILLSFNACNQEPKEQEKIRGFMIDAPRGIETIDYYFRLIDFCQNEGINVILFRLTDDQGSAYKFTSHPELNMCDGAFSAKELKSIIKYAKDRGIEMIPEVESFGHSKYITESKKYEHLNDAPEGAKFNALCPVNDSTLVLLKDLYTEVASIFESKYFHIGCDEVNWGESEKSKNALKSKSKNQIWAKYVNQLNEHIKDLGKETVIWGDVPLYHEKEVLDMLNKDIVIMDWNYWETNTDTIAKIANRVLSKGFKLMACPAVSWCEWGPRVGALQFENISAYAEVYNQLDNTDNLGIILSNWVPTRYLQNSQWDTYTIAANLINDKGDGDYMNIIPKYVKNHFGVNYNADWEKIYTTIYEDIPQWKCGQNDSLIFIPWHSEKQVEDIVKKNHPLKNKFTEVVRLLSTYKDSIKNNKPDFDALLLTSQFIDYNLNRQNELLAFVRSQEFSVDSVESFFQKIAVTDQVQLSKIDSAWSIGRLSRKPIEINEDYLWSFNKAANYSKYLSENPNDFNEIIRLELEMEKEPK